MEQNASRRTPAPAAAVRTEQVLESYYGQLMAWGTLLTRANVGQAQDVVHDFYLHLTLTKPDQSGVANLDGYLYKSLRHIYLSGLARSSREALQFTSIAEFDSVQFALAPNRLGDPLQRQNDLRKVCCYFGVAQVPHQERQLFRPPPLSWVSPSGNRRSRLSTQLRRLQQAQNVPRRGTVSSRRARQTPIHQPRPPTNSCNALESTVFDRSLQGTARDNSGCANGCLFA